MHWKETSDESIARKYVIETHGAAMAIQAAKSCEYYLKASLSFFTIVIPPPVYFLFVSEITHQTELNVQAMRRNWVNTVEDLFHYAVKYTNSLQRHTSSKWKIECYAV